MKNIEIGAMTFGTAETLDEYEAGSAEQRGAVVRLLRRTSDMAALCAVAMEYVRNHVAGEGHTEQGVAMSVVSAAEFLAYMAYEDSNAALSALEEQLDEQGE